MPMPTYEEYYALPFVVVENWWTDDAVDVGEFDTYNEAVAAADELLAASSSLNYDYAVFDACGNRVP